MPLKGLIYHIKYFPYLFALYALACIILFSGISKQSVDKHSDEIIHLRVIQEMYHSKDFLTPTYNSDVYYNKPPLKMWLTQIPLSFLGESDFSYRLIDGVLGLILITLVLLLSKNIFNSLSPGPISGFILLLSKELIWGAHGFRKGTQDDLLLVLLTTSYIYLWDVIKESKFNLKSSVPLFVTIGLSCLTKSIAGLLPLSTLGLYVLFNKTLSPLKKFKYLLNSVLLSILIPAFYFIYHCIKSPVAWKKFFYIELYERATKGMHHIGEPYFYLKELFMKHSFTLPILTVSALLYSLSIIYYKRDIQHKFLLTLASLPVLLYSLPNSRLPWYIFPAYIPLSLIIGSFLTSLLTNIKTGTYFQKAICLSLLLYFTPHYYQRFVKVTDFYLNFSPKFELTIDRLSKSVLKDPTTQIYVDPDLFDTRALVGRRKPNRDAFYWTMIEHRLSPTKDISKGYLVIPESKAKEELSNLKDRITSQEILPKGRGREERAVIFLLAN